MNIKHIQTPARGFNFIFATSNTGKMKEINAIFAERGLSVYSQADIGLDFEAVEDGKTFEENAVIKAAAGAKALREGTFNKEYAVMADDSGLVIDALDGQPGVLSARFLGADTPYTVKNEKLLAMLQDVPDVKRTARFHCAIACALPCGKILTAEGAVEGVIAHEARGINGFGYDPLFFLPEYGLTTAELSQDEKNRISHRGRALRAMLALLETEDVL